MKATKEGQEENEGRICRYVGTWILTLSPSHNRLVFMLTRSIPDPTRECAGAPTLLADRNSGSFWHYKGHCGSLEKWSKQSNEGQLKETMTRGRDQRRGEGYVYFRKSWIRFCRRILLRGPGSAGLAGVPIFGNDFHQHTHAFIHTHT